MKLFLASSFDKTAHLFEQKLQTPLKGKKVIFIANASDNTPGDKWWITSDREAFTKLGALIIDTDLRSISKENFLILLETSDIIHFCGGSVLYTIKLLKDGGFDCLITDFVRTNKIIYTGTSAGSMIVSKDLSLSIFDPEEKPFLDKMKDFSGLSLVEFLIMPHANNADFAEEHSKIIKELPNFTMPVIFIHDHQAVWLEDKKFEIVSA